MAIIHQIWCEGHTLYSRVYSYHQRSFNGVIGVTIILSHAHGEYVRGSVANGQDFDVHSVKRLFKLVFPQVMNQTGHVEGQNVIEHSPHTFLLGILIIMLSSGNVVCIVYS